MRPTKVDLSPWQIWASIFNLTEGRFFSVRFRKKDGTIRKMNGRIFEKLNPDEPHEHICVTDVHVAPDERGNKIRKINPETILGFKCQNFKVGAIDDE